MKLSILDNFSLQSGNLISLEVGNNLSLPAAIRPDSEGRLLRGAVSN